eukprot:3370520-Pleurochrysis_carterae.AAC.2
MKSPVAREGRRESKRQRERASARLSERVREEGGKGRQRDRDSQRERVGSEKEQVRGKWQSKGWGSKQGRPMHACIAQSGMDISMVEKFFHVIDSEGNGDGKVTIEEFINYHLKMCRSLSDKAFIDKVRRCVGVRT